MSLVSQPTNNIIEKEPSTLVLEPTHREIHHHDNASRSSAHTTADANCQDLVPDGQEQWHDSSSSNFNCMWYGSISSDICAQAGDDYSNFGMTANEACCACGGGATAAPLVASAVGDPHLSNIGGDHFDVYKPGNLVLLQLPRRAEPASTFLLVEADARRMGDPCSVYFQFVTISGTWTNQSEPIRFSADPNGKPSGTTWKQWMHFGTVDMKVTYHEKGVGYLNIYVKNLGHTGYEVGGLLGSDDHTDVAVRPRQCPRHRGALLMSSVAGAS